MIAPATPVFAAARNAVQVAASIDRVEETWLVLDVPPHPSLPVPGRTGATGLREGDAVEVFVASDQLGTWRVVRVESTRLTLADAYGQFEWPRALAPPRLGRGDRLRFEVEADPVRRARVEAAVRALQERAESP